jgi:hypothetical protein
MGPEPGKMGTGILDKSRKGKLFPTGPSSQFMLALKDHCLKACLLQVAGDDRPVVSSTNDNRIVTGIWHGIFSLMNAAA